jgi:hypothetical protein
MEKGKAKVFPFSFGERRMENGERRKENGE